jgi:beta-lactamase class A
MVRLRLWLAVAVAVTVWVGLATPSQAVAAQPAGLTGLFDGILPDQGGGEYGLVLEDLRSGARLTVNAQREFPSASLYKLGLAWMVLRQVELGGLSLDESLSIEAEDAVEGEPLGGYGPGDTPTVREALAAMISLSSNNSAHAFLRTLGRASFNREMERIGLDQTRVPEDATDQDATAVTSAVDMARLLRLVATSQQLSATTRGVLMDALANAAPPDALRDALPPHIQIMDKTGNLDDASNVGALLQSARGTAILVVLDRGVDPGDARGVIAQAGAAAYRALLQ